MAQERPRGRQRVGRDVECLRGADAGQRAGERNLWPAVKGSHMNGHARIQSFGGQVLRILASRLVYNLRGSVRIMEQIAPAKPEEQKRRSERVLLRVPIEVKGKREDGEIFREKTFTLVINRHGARISLKNSLRAGTQLIITNLYNRVSCPFRVVGRTGKSLGEGPEWGVECLEPGVNFWGISFPTKPDAPAEQELVDALLECSECHFRELAQLKLEQYRAIINQSALNRGCPRCGAVREWKFGFVEAQTGSASGAQAVPAPSTPASAEGADRRQARRVTIKLPLRIRLQDGQEELTRTENLSRTGVCFASNFTIAEGESVFLTLGYSSGGKEEELPACIVWCRPIEGVNRTLYGVHLEEEF